MPKNLEVNDRHKIIASRLEELVPPKSSRRQRKLVIDVGCYKGRLGYLLRKMKYKTIGFDISVKCVDECRRLGLNTFIKDITKQPLKAWPKADAVVCSELLEHLTEQGFHVAVRNLDSMLDSGGVLIITVPEKEEAIEKHSFHKRYVTSKMIKEAFPEYDLLEESLVYKNEGARLRNSANLMLVFKKQ